MSTTISRMLLVSVAVACCLCVLSPSRLAAQASKGVHVCLGNDNVLRYTSGERCPQGQRIFRLAEVEDEVGVTKDRDDPPNAVVADLKSKVDFLTTRVANLEGELRKMDMDSKATQTNKKSDPTLPTQVRAPFEVVDKSGNPIFVVADAPHGLVPRRGRFEIARSTMGDNHFSLLVRTAGGKEVVGFGEMTDGGGMYIADGTAKTRLFFSSDKGVQVYGKTNLAAHILASEGNNGQFWLYNASGLAMVRAGTEGTVGVVGAGPNIKCGATAGLRAPDCLVGRQ